MPAQNESQQTNNGQGVDVEKEDEDVLQQKLWAFWYYDIFPYVLGDVVEEIMNNGRVSTKEYTGKVFKPIVILPYEQGKKQWDEVEKLRAEYNQAKRELEKEYKAKVQAVIGFDPTDWDPLQRVNEFKY